MSKSNECSISVVIHSLHIAYPLKIYLSQIFTTNYLNSYFFFNPLAPKSDEHLISPHYITPELNIKVMRIDEMITN